MLGRMLAAAWLTALALATPPPDAVPTPDAAPSLRAPAQAARQRAEDSQLRELVPPPLTDAGISAIAAALGADADAAPTVQELASRYRMRLDAEHAKATAEIRARLTSAYADGAAGALTPAPGPELVAALELSGSWRTLLAAADADLLKQLLIVRTEHATASPALISYRRCVERDDAPSNDPIAALRVPELLDTAALSPAERRRVEDALDRHWARTALAISARREARRHADLEGARLQLQWGASWQLTSTAAETAQRRLRLAELDERVRIAEDELRIAVRDSVQQLIRLIPQDAAARIRDQVDALAWPALYVQEELLARAVALACQGAEEDMVDAMRTVLAEMQRRLEPTRREVSRRAARAEELDASVASVELGAAPEAIAASINARLELLDSIDRRRKIVRDTAVQLRHMAFAAGIANADALKERVQALDADARTAAWLREGLLNRLAELEQGGRERVEEPPIQQPSSTEP
ncbi:MAG: hypothetical protein JNK53_06490 [Phycisphaerae bacterium]|nr:hypothetical protein [Phycisphaerae bacterium]